MQICLIRHGQPDWLAGGTGTMDPRLTPLGISQAAHLARVAGDWPTVDEIWISPAVRSQETAAPLVRALGAPARTLDWLVEARGPDLEGRSLDEIRSTFAGSRYRSVAEWWQGLPGAESLQDFTDRIASGFAQEFAALSADRVDGAPHWRGLPKGRRVVIVSHAGTSGTALAHLLGLAPVPWSWERFRLGHAAMVTVRTAAIADGLIFTLGTFNDRRHLPPDLHTI